MTITFQPKLQSETYNGWSNYATWNVALWIGNDEGLYDAAREFTNYQDLVELLYECGSTETPDGVKWNDPELNHIELNEMLEELRD